MRVNIPDLKGGIPQTRRFAHPNSMKAFKDIDLRGKHKEIYNLCFQKDMPLTDREIKDLLGYSDMNSVRPRISELIDFGFLKETGKIKDYVTRKTVRLVKAVQKPEIQLNLFK